MNEAIKQMHSDLVDLSKACKNTKKVKMEMYEASHEIWKRLFDLDPEEPAYYAALGAYAVLKTYADKL